jgi:hypothetical protein
MAAVKAIKEEVGVELMTQVARALRLNGPNSGTVAAETINIVNLNLSRVSCHHTISLLCGRNVARFKARWRMSTRRRLRRHRLFW